MTFTAEDKLVDQYVEIKEKEDTDKLVAVLIEEHFLPQGRFEESRSWKNVIADKALAKEIAEKIKESSKRHPGSNVVRVPQNEDWSETSATEKAHKSDDQQYHYDRSIGYFNASKLMLDDVDDVRICRNEWITAYSKSFFEALKPLGGEHKVISMALSDYIEFFLLPNKLVSSNVESDSQIDYTNIEDAYASRSEVIDYLRGVAPAVLKENYLLNFFCQTGVVGAKTDEIIVTDNNVLFVPKKKSGWGAGEFGCIPISEISSVSVGSEVHTEYAGITSKTQSFWTLTFVTKQYQEFTRWLYLGKNEAEMNQNRPIHGKVLDGLAQYFTLTQGDSFQSSGGYTTSFGIGFWA